MSASESKVESKAPAKSIDEKTPAQMFVENIEDLADTLVDIIETVKKDHAGIKLDPNIILVAKEAINIVDKDRILKNYIQHSHQHWDKIYDKDRKFFTSEDGAQKVFSALPVGAVKEFQIFGETKNSEGKYIVEQKDIEILWEYFHSLTRLSIRHIHLTQGPCMVESADGTIRRAYKRNFLAMYGIARSTTDSIDLNKHARKWNVELVFPPLIQSPSAKK